MNQQNLIECIKSLQKQQTLIIEAEAGAGKTWSVIEALQQLLDEDRLPRTAVIAPTHVAKIELASKASEELRLQVDFMTSAKAAGRFLEMDKATGILQNRFTGKNSGYDLMILDEISATPSIDQERLMRSDAAIVCLGDREQLQAVKSREAPIWNDNWQFYGGLTTDGDYYENGRSFTYVHLEGQMRNSGAIWEMCQRNRYSINWQFFSEPGIRVYHIDEELEQSFIRAIEEEAAKPHPELSQLCWLAYTNRRVDEMQRMLRRFAFHSDIYVPGEVVRVSSLHGYAPGQLLTVLRCRELSVWCNDKKYQAVELIFVGDESTHLVRHPLHNAEYAEDLANAKIDAMDTRNWDKFWKLANLLGDVSNANVMTTDKSQGRTIDRVWVDVVNIKQRRKRLYVAYSRARLQLNVVSCYKNWKDSVYKDWSLEQLNNLRT